jgi:hypothetical protein
MDQQGHTVIEHAFSCEALEEMRQYVKREALRHDGPVLRLPRLEGTVMTVMGRLCCYETRPHPI